MDGKLPFKFYHMPKNPLKEVIVVLEESMAMEYDENTIVYVGGDGRLCVALNHYFRKGKSWNSKKIKTKPFWFPNKQGLE